MGMTVKKSADAQISSVFYSNKGKVADIPMGVSVSTAELVNGAILLDGTPVGAATSGIRKAVKMSLALAGSTSTNIKVATATNQFKVGDFLMSKVGGIAYAITVITSSAGVDTMTVGTAIDAPLSNGNYVYQAAAQAAATTSAFLVSPVAIVGTNTLVDNTTNLTVDAWVIAAVKKSSIGADVLSALKVNNAFIAEI